MPAPKGNKYWQFRDKHGRDYQYKPEELWDEAVKYFQWVEDNPLYEAVTIQRGITIEDEEGNKKIEYFAKAPKMRAMTIKAFCLFADITHTTWDNYKANKDFVAIVTRIEDIIYSQKFEGASASLLNHNIIARELGLAEKTNNTNTNLNYNSVVSKEEAKKISEDLENEC